MENELNLETQTANEETGAVVESKKSFQELLDTDKEYRSAFDKLITKATETAVSKAKIEFEKQAEQQKSEAEKLAKMNADEKLNYELTQTKNENERLTNYINSLELQKTANTYATESGLPIEYLKDWDFTKENAESVKSKIDNLITIRQKDMETYMNTKLKQDAPKVIESSVSVEDPYIKGFKSYK